jgi:hypothetical protein
VRAAEQTGFAGLLLAVTALALASAAPAAFAKAPGLKLSEKSAAPGHVVLLSGKGLNEKKAKVSIGGKKAEVATRSKKKLGAVVPDLKPGRAPVVARSGKRRLRGSLKVAEGFDGELVAALDPLRASTAEIGQAGGRLTATAADGTAFTLNVPEGALAESTTITMTPVTGIPGFPLSGRPLAVDLAPDGLEFWAPATLRIDPAKALQGAVAGFTFGESDPGLDLQTPEGSGGPLTLAIEHFSTSGAATISERDFFALIGRLIIEDLDNELDFGDVAEFARALSVFAPAFNFRCSDNPTCAWLFGQVVDEAEVHVDSYQCPSENEAVLASLRVSRLIQMLEEDGVLRLLGRNELVAELEAARRCETGELVREIADAARSDALDATLVNPINSRDRGRSDRNRDGEIANCEWAVYVATIAAQQGFTELQAAATDACEAGLHAAIEEARPKCDQATTHAAGMDELRKAESIDASLGLATSELVAAREHCTKITVTPNPGTVEVGDDLDFTATAKDPGDISFAWSADRGTIDGAGLLTAPATPGPLTVTATSDQNRERSGRAQVTVVCPNGQVEFQGQCRTISVTISPTSANLAPGGTRQFTASVSNTSDTRVTWHASGGSITQSGFFTAPGAPGAYTVTAVSRADPSKSAQATVNVAGAEVEIISRPGPAGGAQMGAHASAGNDAFGEDCGNEEQDSFQIEAPSSELWSPSLSASATAASGAADPGLTCQSGSASANTSMTSDNEASDAGGRLTASFDLEGSAVASATGSGDAWAYFEVGSGIWFEVKGPGTVTLWCSGEIPPGRDGSGLFSAPGVQVFSNGMDPGVFEFAHHDDPGFSVTLGPSDDPGDPPEAEFYFLGFGYSEEAGGPGDAGENNSSEMNVTCSA